MMEQDLSKRFGEVMEEAKMLVKKSTMDIYLSANDEKDIMETSMARRVLIQTLDLCGYMFEEQNKLMDKMDKSVG